MQFLIGAVTVLVCTFGAYILMGGHIEVIAKAAPLELVIILGSGIGAFIIGNSKVVLKGLFPAIKHAAKGPKYSKADFLEALSMMYQVFKLAKTKGMLSLEQHIENPGASGLFGQFPKFQANTQALTFFCDYLRMVSLGSDKAHELETLMDEEIEVLHSEETAIADSVQTLADALPALGIVAAVLGVIKTMAAISEPPEVLGGLIGSALVGTFLGVWMAYGFVGPIAGAMKSTINAEDKYFKCLKVGLMAHLSGYAPSISIEFARKTLNTNVRPSFTEVEEATTALPPP